MQVVEPRLEQAAEGVERRREQAAEVVEQRLPVCSGRPPAGREQATEESSGLFG